METIDIIGVFSKGDCYSPKNEVPVLYKIIESNITNNFAINHVYLFNSFDSNENFEKSFPTILESLKENYSNYDFSSLSKITYANTIDDAVNADNGVVLFQMQNNKETQINFSDYFPFFREVSVKSNASCLFYNLQSGNIQSREAIQIVCEFFADKNKKRYLYSESIKNEDSTHVNNEELLMFCKDKDACSIVDDIAKKEGINNIINRIKGKNINDIIKEFHDAIILDFFNKNRYFEAYYHYTFNSFIYKQKSKELLDVCFYDNVRIKSFANKFNDEIVHVILKKDFSYYFLSRLVYINAKLIENQIERPLYEVIERLLFVLEHLENKSEYVEKKDNCYLITDEEIKNNIKYIDCLDTYYKGTYKNNGMPLEQLKINYINSYSIIKFSKSYKSFRHVTKDYQNKYEILKCIFEELKIKFEKEYKIYLEDYIEDDFNGIFNSIIKEFKEEITVDLSKLNKISNEEIDDKKICILSMCGSTDPINTDQYKNEYLGSTLSFMYGINDINCMDKNENSILLNKLHKYNLNKKIPLYFIMSKESINLLLNKNNEYFLEENDLNKIYRTNVNVIPFACHGNYKELIHNYIVEDKNDAKNKLMELTQLCNGEYTIINCQNYIDIVVESLLKKYDKIFVIESSGIPNCKMTLSFMSLLHPTQIVPITIKNPKLQQPESEKTENKEKKLIKNNNIKPILVKDNLLGILIQDEREYSNLIYYLIQEKKYDEDDDFFKSSKLNNILDDIKNHDNPKYHQFNLTTEIARLLCKCYYLLEFNFNSSAIKFLDKVLEVIGKRLRDNNNVEGLKLNLININKNSNIYEFYKRFEKNYNFIANKFKNVATDVTDFAVSFEYRKTNDKSKVNDSRTNIYDSIYNAFVYGSNHNIECLGYIERIFEIWKYISLIKHSNSKHIKSYYLSIEDLNNIVSFDKEIEKKYKEELHYYEKIKSLFSNPNVSIKK